MNVQIALLAEYAVAQSDAKLSILGAGLDQIRAPVLPFVQGNLAFVLRMTFADDEVGQEQAFRIEVTGPEGPIADSTYQFAMQVIHPPWQVNRVAVPLVHNFRDLSFGAYGTYTFSLLRLDGTNLATTTLNLTPTGTDEHTETKSERMQRMLNQGFTLFRQGEVDRALEMFDAVVEEDPESASGHNNRGFVLLTKGRARASEALTEFEKARQYGYHDRSTLDANAATALYLQKRYSEAVEQFRDGMAAELRSPTYTMLMVLIKKGVAVIAVTSPADYVALMAFNAARSALAGGMKDEAEQFFQMATTGRVSFGPDSTFSAYLNELAEELGKTST